MLTPAERDARWIKEFGARSGQALTPGTANLLGPQDEVFDDLAGRARLGS